MLLELIPKSTRGTWRSFEQQSHKILVPQSVRYVEGAFLFLRCTHFDAIGGFDEGFSFFFEDADLPIRLLNAGFDVQFVPSVSIVHLGGESFSQVPVWHKEEYYRNFLQFHKRHALRRAIWMQRIYNLCFNWFANILFVLKRISGISLSNKINQRWQIISAIANIYTPKSLKKIDSENPLVSVIIPTYNRPDCLKQLLQKLQFQVYKNYEVIVVDQSDEKSILMEHIVSEFSYPIIFLHSDYPNRSNAKNIGIRHAKGEIILFCDDDITPSDDMLKVHVKYHRDSAIGGVSCRIIENNLPPLKSTDICYVTWYGRMKDGYQSDVSCDVGTLVGGNMSMQRDILHEIGYFDANYIGTSIFEEQDISERLKNMGYRIHFTNETTIVHQPQNNGNVNLQNIDTSQYYYNFNHNEILYFLKNRNHLLLLFVIPFCILRAFKKTIQFHLSVSESCRILYGIVDGVKKYHHSLKL